MTLNTQALVHRLRAMEPPRNSQEAARKIHDVREIRTQLAARRKYLLRKVEEIEEELALHRGPVRDRPKAWTLSREGDLERWEVYLRKAEDPWNRVLLLDGRHAILDKITPKRIYLMQATDGWYIRSWYVDKSTGVRYEDSRYSAGDNVALSEVPRLTSDTPSTD